MEVIQLVTYDKILDINRYDKSECFLLIFATRYANLKYTQRGIRNELLGICNLSNLENYYT